MRTEHKLCMKTGMPKNLSALDKNSHDLRKSQGCQTEIMLFAFYSALTKLELQYPSRIFYKNQNSLQM